MAPHTDGGTQDPVASLLHEFPGQRVLVVDDDEFVRSVLLDMLDDTGLCLDEARDGSEALALCTRTRYALVLMDMMMPGMSGVEAAQHIRRLPGREHMPILALTGNTAMADRISCLQAGMSDFVTKPMRSDALAATILHWLRSSPP